MRVRKGRPGLALQNPIRYARFLITDRLPMSPVNGNTTDYMPTDAAAFGSSTGRISPDHGSVAADPAVADPAVADSAVADSAVAAVPAGPGSAVAADTADAAAAASIPPTPGLPARLSFSLFYAISSCI